MERTRGFSTLTKRFDDVFPRFARRGGSADGAAAWQRGYSLSEENTPFRSPRERRGESPSTPALRDWGLKSCPACGIRCLPSDVSKRFGLLLLPAAALPGNVKKCAVGKHPKSEKHGNTAQFSEVERSGTQENCGGIGSGCRLRLRPLPVLRRRQSQRVARIDPNAVVVDKNIAENDRFDLFSR